MRKEATEGARRHPPLPSLVFVGRQLSYLTEEIGSSRFFLASGSKVQPIFFRNTHHPKPSGQKEISLILYYHALIYYHA